MNYSFHRVIAILARLAVAGVGFHSFAPKEFPGNRSLQRDLGVPQSFEAVNPIGNPISHSTQYGFSLPLGSCASTNQSNISERSFPSLRIIALPPPLCIRAVGVGNHRAHPSSVVPPVCPFVGIQATCAPLDTVGVGNKEPSVAGMGCAAIGCSDTSPFRREPHRGKVCEYGSESVTKDCCDVFKEQVTGSNDASNTEDFPIKAGSCLMSNARLIPGNANILAREACMDAIHFSGVLGWIEQSDIPFPH